jgi:hypothetical protein
MQARRHGPHDGIGARRAPGRSTGRLAAIALALLVALPALAGTPPIAATRAELTAAMILKFAGFISWHVPLGDTLRVAVVDDPPVHDALLALADRHNRARSPEDGAAPGLPRAILVTDALEPADAARCHVLYIGDPSRADTARFLELAHAGGALTVATADESGVQSVIRLFREGSRLRFDVDQSAAQTAQLKISSLLLNLARQSSSGIAAPIGLLAQG